MIVNESQPAQTLNSTTSIFLDASVDREFASRGYIGQQLLSAGEISALQKVFSQLVLDVPTGFYATAFDPDNSNRRRLHESIVEIVGPALQSIMPGYVCAASNFVVKRAGAGDSKVPLHQDFSFVDPRLYRSVNVWIPLVDVTMRNGCLMLLPGSQRVVGISAPGTGAPPWENIRGNLEAMLVAHPVSAGTAIVYDGNLLHASEANQSSQIRIAANCVMLPRDVPPRIYVATAAPNILDVYEFGRDSFHCFDPIYGVSDQCLNYVTLVEQVSHQVEISLEQFHMQRSLAS